ncbi:MAG TPA: hypothetical protein VHY30_09850 [Verrucomicrobiae bacterium]|jgi:outer membrane protein assembly factor BamE (lipoprotein component of BamABCDE complex)|nr:hypothetical protein [Verrucomicrobiae bacterium]
MKTTIAILFCAALLTGCSSVGTNFNSANVPKIQKGITTETDLVTMFGQPNQRGVNSENGTTLTWIYSEATVKGATFIPYVGIFAGGVNTKNKTLTVRLDTDGKVSGYDYSGGAMGSSGMTQSDPGSTNQNSSLKSPKASAQK